MNNKPGEIEIPDTHLDLLTSYYPATLTTIRCNDGNLSTNPVSFLWEQGAILISTLKSRMKYKNILADPRVAVCVVSPQNRMHYIELRGKATLEDDPQAQLNNRMFQLMTGQDAPQDMDPPGAERAIIRLVPEQVSCPRVYGGRFHNMEKP